MAVAQKSQTTQDIDYDKRAAIGECRRDLIRVGDGGSFIPISP